MSRRALLNQSLNPATPPSVEEADRRDTAATRAAAHPRLTPAGLK